MVGEIRVKILNQPNFLDIVSIPLFYLFLSLILNQLLLVELLKLNGFLNSKYIVISIKNEIYKVLHHKVLRYLNCLSRIGNDYIGRTKEKHRSFRCHSDFYLGLSAPDWPLSCQLLAPESCALRRLSPHKAANYQQGLKDISLMQSVF